PAPPQERLTAVDALRGFALLGILLVNMSLFSIPFIDEGASAHLFPGPLDRAVDWLISLLAEAKFISLFAFLFGWGLYQQGERAGAERLTRRRLWLLLLFGLLHALLLWSGDILLPYAVLGLLALRFRRRPPRSLAIWAGISLALPLAAGGLIDLWVGPIEPEAGLSAAGRWVLQAYQQGSYGQLFLARLLELGAVYASMLLSGGVGQIFGLFLLGMLAAQTGLLRDLPAHRPLLERLFRWGLPVGVAFSLLLTQTGGSTLAYALGAVLGGGSLGLAYGAGLVLLLQRPDWSRRLAPLASAGRMALTNYLLQSAICTTLFYSYGFGLYGRISPSAGLLLSFLIYSMQVMISHWWLQRFHYGPFEWLWRSLTYQRIQPLRT
ncbi:MAG: DUF418 domain-containing protein, partial [Bacillota bacterium]